MPANTRIHPLLVLSTAAAIAALLAMTTAEAHPHPASRSPGGPAATETAIPTCVPAPKGMTAWWRFEYLEDGEPPQPAFYRDSAGVNNHAEVRVAPVPTAGRVGGALQFDGATQFLEAPDHPELDLGTADFTIDAWVRQPPDATGVRTILDKRSFSPVRGYAFFTINGRLSLQLGDGSAAGDICGSDPTQSPCTNYNSGKRIDDGAWHFVAVSVSRPVSVTRAVFYIDGETIPFNAALRALSLDNDAPLRIGQHAEGAGLWQGGLDEIELFGRALSDSELGAIYGAGQAGKCSPEGSLRGIRELVNLDAVNLCDGDATGFQFSLSNFAGGIYDANSANFSFNEVFERVCPPNTTANCNPFSPDEAKPQYWFDHIALAWQNSHTTRIVKPKDTAHFGYTLNTGDNDNFHMTQAEWRLQSAGPPCFALGESVQWEAPQQQLSQSNPLAGADQGTAVGVAIQNSSQLAMQATVWGFASPERLRLDDLLSSNLELWRLAGEPLTTARLEPRAAVSVTIPVDDRSWGMVVITEWHDGETGALRGRSFRARPVNAAVLPTATPSTTPPLSTITSTATPTHLTVTTTPTGTPSTTPLSPTATPSATRLPPSPAPSGTPTASPEPTSMPDTPTVPLPTSSSTPLPHWSIFLPALRRERFVAPSDAGRHPRRCPSAIVADQLRL